MGKEHKYSLARAICAQANGHALDGLEGEVHKEFQKNRGYGTATAANGFWVPFSAMRRDLNVTTAAQGGNFVETEVSGDVIEILRNRCQCQRLGVQLMAGLTGNLAIPRQTAAATAYTVSEQGVLAASTQGVGQIMLTPHRVGAQTKYTKQLLVQSSVAVSDFLNNDLMAVMGVKIDSLILQGAGGTDPLGILNTTGIGSVSFGGAADYAHMIAFETALTTTNADTGKMAYLVTPGARAKLKNVPKVGSTFPIYIWEDGTNTDGFNDGKVNGYRAASTNQIANNLAFFGNWSDAYLAMFGGGFDIVVDQYTLAASGTVIVTVNAFVDVAVRHAPSFCVSTDSAAQ